MENRKLKSLAISENGFIFDPETGYSYNVNETGLRILKLMQAGMTKDQIIESLVDEYETSRDNAQSDFSHFLAMINSMNILEVDDGNRSE